MTFPAGRRCYDPGARRRDQHLPGDDDARGDGGTARLRDNRQVERRLGARPEALCEGPLRALEPVRLRRRRCRDGEVRRHQCSRAGRSGRGSGGGVRDRSSPRRQRWRGDDGRFPEFVCTSPESLAAYRLAATNRGLLSQIPRYCRCVDLPGKLHESLDDCFFDSGGSFDSHAVGCDLCQEIAQDATGWRGEGDRTLVVRSKIDARYRAFGPATNTPPVSP